jgi:hypothetical protein
LSIVHRPVHRTTVRHLRACQPEPSVGRRIGGLLVSERRGRLDSGRTARVLRLLRGLTVAVDADAEEEALMQLARSHPLATLDASLATAARRCHFGQRAHWPVQGDPLGRGVCQYGRGARRIPIERALRFNQVGQNTANLWQNCANVLNRSLSVPIQGWQWQVPTHPLHGASGRTYAAAVNAAERVSSVPRLHRRCWPASFGVGQRWSAGLVESKRKAA